MKKLKMIVIILFAIVFVSGCSCTSSMCSDEDLNKIQESIKNKWSSNEEYKTQLREEALTKDITEENLIEQYVNQKIEERIKSEFESHPKACLTTTDMIDPDSGATISAKSWKAAWKQGLLEGLIVYPISCMLIAFTNWFGGSGAAQILSIVVSTLIIKLVFMFVTFKNQIQTQKMQNIQPEIAQITAKLKDPNLSEAEKNRLSMKVMEIYKKNGVNPLGSLLPMFIQLPIFLSVWSAVSQTLVIRTGEFLGLNLGQAMSTQVFNFSIAAIVLFVLLAASQVLSMKMPNIIRKKQASYKDKAKIDEANKQMSMTTNIMLIMILISGFVLPAALVIYWVIGAIFSILQTIVLNNTWVKQKISEFGNRKKKAKVVQ